MRKTLAVVLAVLLVLALGAGAAAWWLTRPGHADQLAQVLGRQVAKIANTYLVPELDFDRVDYTAPGTLTLSGVSLTAPDGTRVVDLDTMTVVLAEVPSRDRPLRIASVRLSGGTVSIVRDPATGEVRGLVPFVERGVSADDQAGVGEEVRLSEVLVLERVEIRDVDLSIDLGDGPMVLEGFALAMDVRPAEADGPGWYAVDFESGRAPGLELALAGRLNVDSFTLAIDTLTGAAELTPDTYATLPGALAEPLRQRDARGRLAFDAAGTLALTRPLGEGTALRTSATLTDFNVAAGDYRLPIDRAELTAPLAGGAIEPLTLRATLLKGRAEIAGPVRPGAPGMPADLRWTLDGLDLADLLARQGPDAPDLAGLVSGAGTATTSLADPLASMSGSGELRLREGRLVAIPILTELAEVASIAGFGRVADRNHALDAAFTLTGEGVRLDRSEVVTSTMGARATGLVGYDGRLDLDVNAGPLEKVQDLLGKLGDVLGAVTDRLVTYRVRGTARDPEITVAPLGIGG